MSIWERINRLSSDIQREIISIYQQPHSLLPIDVRTLLAPWIEQQNWSPDQNLANYQKKCVSLLNGFCAQIYHLYPSCDVSCKFKIEDFHTKLKEAIESNDFGRQVLIVSQVYGCLQAEQAVLMRCQENRPQQIGNQVTNSFLQGTKEKIAQTDQLLQRLNHNFNSLQIDFAQNDLGCVPTSQLNDNAALHREIGQIQVQLTEKHRAILEELNSTRIELNLKLCEMRHGNNRQIDTSSPEFKGLTANIQELLSFIWTADGKQWTLLSSIKVMDSMIQRVDGEIYELASFREHYNWLCSSVHKFLQLLLNMSLTVEHVCPTILSPSEGQVKDLELVSALFLLGGLIPQVSTLTIRLIHENQANEFYINRVNFNADQLSMIDNFSHRRLHKNTAQLKLDSASGISHSDFMDLALEHVKRATRTEKCSVLDTKHAFLLSTDLWIDNWHFTVQSISEPMVVTSHANQKIRALATIFWHNTFSDPRGNPYQVAQSATFQQLVQALSDELYQETGKHLSDENKRFMATKIFHDTNASLDYTVTFQQFAHDKLVDDSLECDFTFWQWFYAAQQLIYNVKPLTQLWCADLLMGFVSKARAKQLLINQPLGTILLRFSDKQLGSVSVAYNMLQNNGEQGVLYTEPKNGKRLEEKPLPDRIHQLAKDGAFSFLYPGRNLIESFRPYYSVSNKKPVDPRYTSWRMVIIRKISRPFHSMKRSRSDDSYGNAWQ